MTAKEIIEGMSGTPWKVDGRFVTTDSYGLAFRTQHLAEAACVAVNNTLLKGYDPIKMDEMYKAMREFCDRVERGEVRSTKTYNQFIDILNTAKIK